MFWLLATVAHASYTPDFLWQSGDLGIVEPPLVACNNGDVVAAYRAESAFGV